MDNELVLSTIRSCQDRRAVSAAALASELDVDVASLQAVLDGLVESGELGVSELRTRRNEGYPFAVRAIWYHTPDREVAARFGVTLAVDGTRSSRPRTRASVSVAC
jgi:hypothetical protein